MEESKTPITDFAPTAIATLTTCRRIINEFLESGKETEAHEECIDKLSAFLNDPEILNGLKSLHLI